MLYDVDKTNVGTYSFIKLNMIVLPIFAYYLIVNIFSYPLSPIGTYLCLHGSDF